MAAVFSEDDRDYFNKFTSARSANYVGADVLEDVHSVLSNREFSSTTRLAAAKLLVHAEDIHGSGVSAYHPSVDWIVLTAMLEAANAERVAKIIKSWMICFRKRRIRDSDDEATFLASFAKILTRKGTEVIAHFTAVEAKRLRKYLIIAYILLSEMERGAKFFDNAILFVTRTMTEEEKFLEYCLDELPAHLRGRYGILKMLIREVSLNAEMVSAIVIDKICKQLSDCMDNQLITNAAADLIAVLVTKYPSSPTLLNLFSDSLVHRLKCVRMNVMRWFGRIATTKDTCQFFSALRDSLRNSFLSAEEDLWPPHIWEVEDVSCIDPIWSCEESEEVLWKADRILDAFLSTSNVLQQRFHVEINANDLMIQAALKWHLPEIRLASFRIWSDCSENSFPQSERDAFLEEFILNNGMSSSANLRKAVELAANSCKMSEHGRSQWMKMLGILKKRAKMDEEQRGSSYLPDELTETDLIPLPAPKQARERLEEFLRISGSNDPKSCPAFPELYENLSKAGYDQRIFARFLIDLVNLIKSQEHPKVALAVISEAVTRCRLKVFVDHGCTIIDELLARHHSEQHFFFLAEYGYCWAMNHLTDKNAQCRTLALSRILWSVCEKSKDLMKIFFESCQTTLADSSLDTKIHERVLKTLKLFTSKAECKMPADFVEFLFWHSIDAQKNENCLVRSAATILYGFVVRYITKSRVVPAFFIVSTRAKFWRDIMSRCSSLSELPQLQRILLLSFLVRLKLGHIDCYAETVLEEIRSVISSLVVLLEKTNDIRERRYCFEVLIEMSSTTALEDVLSTLRERYRKNDSRTSRTDCDFLEYILKMGNKRPEIMECRRVPDAIRESPYVELIENATELDPEKALEKVQDRFDSADFHSAEVTLQAVAMALTRVAVTLRKVGPVSETVRSKFVSQCCAVLDHALCSSRAASIMSRVLTCLGLTRNYLQKCYAVKILHQWSDQGVESSG